MSKGIKEILFALLRSAIYGTPLTESEKELFSDDVIAPLYTLSKHHDMAHLVGYALEKNSLITSDNEYFAKFHKQQMIAIYRYERINYALGELCNALEKAKIPFIPLKGSVLRRYYPEPWMRTSCDIDILIHEYDLERAATYLVEKLSYRREQLSSHDIQMFSPDGVHVELHYDLIEDGRVKKSPDILKDIWSDVSAKAGYGYWFEMSNEMFYFYHIAHMAKHFENGGCGLRPFLDLWILEQKTECDREKLNTLLSRGDILTFTEASEHLAGIWFGKEERTETISQMERYILFGGVYGSTENSASVRRGRADSRFRYAVSRIFLPYDIIKFQYPVLKKHRWLTPFCEFMRWCRLIFCGGIKRSLKELGLNKNTSRHDDAVAKMLADIGL